MGEKRILIVDDEAELREVLRSVLHEAGFEVTVARDGAEALRLFAPDRFDLILTDLLMPEKEGTEVIMSIRREHLTLPIIAMSGGGRMPREDYLALARKFGATEAIEKPFTRLQLMAVIEKLLPAP